jgi:DNA-binding transcriptional ArsR family regulator
MMDDRRDSDAEDEGQGFEGLPEPPAELVITDPEQLKALGDALRLQLLEVMGRQVRHGWSVKELAGATGANQTKLYHHVNLLEARGLLRLAGTQVVSGIVERRYQLAARAFRLDQSLVSGAGGGAAIGALLDAALDETRRQVLASVASGRIDMSEAEPGRRLFIFRNRLRLRPERVAEFTARLRELLEAEDEPEADGATEHGLLVTFYPIADDEPDR